MWKIEKYKNRFNPKTHNIGWKIIKLKNHSLQKHQNTIKISRRYLLLPNVKDIFQWSIMRLSVVDVFLIKLKKKNKTVPTWNWKESLLVPWPKCRYQTVPSSTSCWVKDIVEVKPWSSVSEGRQPSGGPSAGMETKTTSPGSTDNTARLDRVRSHTYRSNWICYWN